jgi:hypothetical protein
MVVEIVPTGELFKDKAGKLWLPVNISFEALRQINKIVLDDKVDKDDYKEWAKRKQVHEDILELQQLFIKD